MKKIRVFAFVLLLVVTLSALPAHAATDTEFLGNSTVTRYTNILRFGNDLTIDSFGKATVSSLLVARNCDEVSLNVCLQQYSGGQWTTIKSWSNYQYGTAVEMSESWYVASGYQYRLVSYGYVYSGGELLESTSYIGGSKSY